jgi:hypothetical protein
MRDHTDMFLEFLPTDCILSSHMSPCLDDAQNDMYRHLVNQNIHDGQQYAHLTDVVSNSLATPKHFGCYDAPPPQSLSAESELSDYVSILQMASPSFLVN